MTVTRLERRAVEAAPSTVVRKLGSLHDLGTAVERSQQYLLQIQKPEGYWIGELMVDSSLVADMVAFHHWDGSVDPAWQRKAVNAPPSSVSPQRVSLGRFKTTKRNFGGVALVVRKQAGTCDVWATWPTDGDLYRPRYLCAL